MARISILLTDEMTAALARIGVLQPLGTRATIASKALLQGLLLVESEAKYLHGRFVGDPKFAGQFEEAKTDPKKVRSEMLTAIAEHEANFKATLEQPLTSTTECPVATNPFEGITK